MKRTDIIEALQARGYKVRARDVQKNNVTFEGIELETECNVAPIVYVDQLINEAMKRDLSIDTVVDHIERAFKDHGTFEIGDALTRDFIIDHIMIGLQQETGEDLEKTATDFEGIEAFLYVIIENDTDHTASYKVRAGMLESAGVGINEAWEHARRNTFETTKIQSMAHVLGFEDDDELGDILPLYVISNSTGARGAANVLDRDALQAFAFKHSTDKIYVIPSSIHECILIPATVNTDLEALTAMVKEVNATVVKPEERLSDRAYEVFF